MDIITRKEAKEKGLKRYYTGEPCKHGHLSDRIVQNGQCLECMHIANAKWRKENHEYEKIRWRKYHEENRDMLRGKGRQRYWDNHEENLKQQANYREENREKERIRGKKYREENPEIAHTACRRWMKNNPDRVAYMSRKRKRLLGNATPPWYENDLVKQIYLKRDELSELWGITLHVDHIIPLQGKTVSGLHCWDNLQLLEATLNISKHNNFENN